MHGIRVVATTALLALGLAARAHGQSAGLGVSVGWTRSSYATNRVVERAGLYAPSFGVTRSIPLAHRLALQIDALYLHKGAAESYTIDMGGQSKTYTDRYGLPYLELPVLARITLPVRGTRLRPFIAAGPYVARLTHCASKVIRVNGPAANPAGTAGGEPVSVNYACYDGRIPRIDAGAVAATGARMPLNPWVVAVADLRYEVGLRNVIQDAPAIRNHTLGLSLGLSLTRPDR